jgi:hypothetical protein
MASSRWFVTVGRRWPGHAEIASDPGGTGTCFDETVDATVSLGSSDADPEKVSGVMTGNPRECAGFRPLRPGVVEHKITCRLCARHGSDALREHTEGYAFHEVLDLLVFSADR